MKDDSSNVSLNSSLFPHIARMYFGRDLHYFYHPFCIFIVDGGLPHRLSNSKLVSRVRTVEMDGNEILNLRSHTMEESFTAYFRGLLVVVSQKPASRRTFLRDI